MTHLGTTSVTTVPDVDAEGGGRSASIDGTPPDRLARLAEHYAAAGAAAALPDRPEGSERRRWTLLHRDERVEAWVIAWPPGSGLALHDHAGSRAAIRVVAGRLRERYAVGGELAVRWWRSGETYELGADHVHEVINTSGAEAVSVHVYAPPTDEIRFRPDAAVEPSSRPDHDR